VSWYRKAAEQGDADAQFKLGSSYAGGRGAPKDDEVACFWLLLAKAGGSDLAAQGCDAIESRLTAQQLERAQLAARAWKPK